MELGDEDSVAVKAFTLLKPSYFIHKIRIV